MGSVTPPCGVGSGRLCCERHEWFDFKLQKTGFRFRDLIIDIRIRVLQLLAVDDHRVSHRGYIDQDSV